MGYSFKKYKLSQKQLEHIAGMCKQEQGANVNAVKFEASLAANLYESRGSAYATINDYIRNSGWFASTSKNKTTSDKNLVNAVKEVLVDGKRVLPPQINEHDWTGDIKSISPSGDKTKRSSYKQFETKVHAIGNWTFYCWPKFTADPFGTTQPDKLKAWLKKYAEKGQYFWTTPFANKIEDAVSKASAKVAYYGPTYETTVTVTKKVPLKEAAKKKGSNINSNIVTPENANTLVEVQVEEKKVVKRKYAWSGHGTPEEDLKKGNLVCAAPSGIPFGTKIKIKATGTKYDGKEFTVKDRLSDTKVKNGKYYVAILVKGNKKENIGPWVNGEIIYETPSRGGTSGADENVEGTLQVSVDKLYSSDNYSYVNALQSAQETAIDKLKKGIFSSVLEKIKGLFSVDEDNETKKYLPVNSDGVPYDTAINLKDINKIKAEKVVSKTMVSGTTSASVLPVVSVAVEAPYFEVEMGGIKIGGYHNNKVPNYVQSLTVKKINSSINEYSISLIHQIRPGDNPNYIDSILSRAGYNYINIRYGNANTGQIFTDQKALVTNVTQNFDFANCNITYNVSATSIAAASAAQRYNFGEYTGKISDRIRELLWEGMTDILDVFPGMKNQASVEQQGLIPTNDAVVTIGAQTDVTSVEYLMTLVNRMTSVSLSSTQDVANSLYILTVEDDIKGLNNAGARFKITEVKQDINNVPFMYEVNVGYPDDNFVLNFSTSNNFAWAIAYEGAKKIVKYDYELDSLGNLTKQNVPAYYENDEDILGYRNLWSSLTRFPINATLTVRGLLQNSLLMQYIKINCVMYGAKRITSGVYIVTEQEDRIGGGVYSTTLNLMRVSGDNEYINLDGRKVT